MPKWVNWLIGLIILLVAVFILVKYVLPTFFGINIFTDYKFGY